MNNAWPAQFHVGGVFGAKIFKTGARVGSYLSQVSATGVLAQEIAWQPFAEVIASHASPRSSHQRSLV
jgi:hypothetical protein